MQEQRLNYATVRCQSIFKFVSLAYLTLSVLHYKIVWCDKSTKYKNQNRKKMHWAGINSDRTRSIYKTLKTSAK